MGPDERLLVVAAHPDDESLCAGGLLARASSVGAYVHVLFATDGENAPWTQRIAERRFHIRPADRERFGARRRAEAVAALHALGLQSTAATFLQMADQGLTCSLLCDSETALARVRQVIRTVRPTTVVVPSLSDLHPDHSALGVLARAALDGEGAFARSTCVWSYLFHGLQRWPVQKDIQLSLSEEEQARKRAAIRCHQSQLTVHRRRYMRVAKTSESFALETSCGSWVGRHPVTRCAWVGDVLELTVRPRARPGAFGPADLLVWLNHGRVGQAIRFPLREGRQSSVGVRDRVIKGSAWIRRVRREWQVHLGLRDLVQPSEAYLKLERQIGFFDEAGWLRVS